MTATILYILGEENPNSDTTYKAAKIALDYLNIEYVSYLSQFFAKRIGTVEYLITGFLSDSFVEIRYKIVSGQSSFVDYLFYLQEHVPTSEDKPFYAIEATKNGFEDAGNMTDQRSEKDVLVKHFFGENTPVAYFLNMKPGAEKEPKNINLQALRRMKTCGMNIFVSYFGQEEYEKINVMPYSSVEELVDNDRNLSLDKDGNACFALPLWKSKNPKQKSDPNVGRLCSITNTLKHLSFEKEFMINNHKLDLVVFQGTSKLNRILNIMSNSYSINIEGLGRLPKLFFGKQEYFKSGDGGEKIASIALEAILREKGLLAVFNNHAGCEKGYILTENGKYVALPTKDEQGQKIAIPDLIIAIPSIKKLIVIEAERLVNKDKGHDQVCNPAFTRGCYEVMKHWPGWSCEIHLVTFGDKCEKDIIYSLDKDNNEVLNMNAQPIIRLEAL